MITSRHYFLSAVMITRWCRPAKCPGISESPEMGRDLQVSRNCKEKSRNLGNLIEKIDCAINANFCRIYAKYVSLSTRISLNVG